MNVCLSSKVLIFSFVSFFSCTPSLLTHPFKYSCEKKFGSEQKKEKFPQESSSKDKAPKPYRYFLCGRSHMVRECPQKQTLNPLIASIYLPRSDKSNVSPLIQVVRILITMMRSYKGSRWEQCVYRMHCIVKWMTT